MAELSVVIVSWNTEKMVAECLESLRRQSLGVALEVILVDNSSSDGTQAMVRRDFPEVMLIENTQNLGFAKANNIGIRRASGKYVCLINSDVNVHGDCLQALWDFMEAHPKVGVAGPRMFGPNGSVGRSYMRFPTWWNCLCNALFLDAIFKGRKLFGGVLMADFDNRQTGPVDVLNGWFLAVRREAIDEVGLLDEDFFMYGEDIDWSYRFGKAGWGRIYFAGARSLHYGGASSARAPLKFYMQMHRADLHYWRKHQGWVGALGFWVTTLVHHAVRIWGYALLYLVRRSERQDTSFKLRRSAACLGWLVGLRCRDGV